MKKLKFTVDSALLRELGEKLVENVHLALAELVKNAYDADSTNVIVRFTEDQNGNPEIHVIDDGIGMNYDEVARYWMHIATTNKLKKNRSPLYGRPRTGSKGIGRFCCRRLGKKLKLITTGKKGKDYQRTEVVFPWEDFEPGTDITKILCNGERHESRRGQTGTTLIVSDIAEDWSKRGYDYLKRQLALLVANRGVRRSGYKEDPGFSIVLDAEGLGGGIRDLRDDFINAGWGTITAHINKSHQAVCELNALGIGNKTMITQRTFPHLKDVKLKIGVLIQKREQMRDTSIISKGNLSSILPVWGGVQVRYKGFRVFPYGDDDWLDIDRQRGLRKGEVTGELHAFAQSLRGVNPKRVLLSMLSMDSYVGNVEIGPEAKNFEMKANREGFIESRALDELKQFVKLTIDWSTICRDYSLRVKAKKDTEAAREYLESVTKTEISHEKVVDAAIEYLQKETKNISALLPIKEKQGFQKSFKQATDVILKYDKSSKEELRHLRLVASTSTLLLIFSHEVKSLLGLLENSSSTLRFFEKKVLGKEKKLVEEMRKDFVSIKTRFDDLLGMTSLIGVDSRKEVPKQLALLEQIKDVEKVYALIIHKYGIDVEYEEGVQPNIFVGPILKAELYAILLNIFSNSIKSVIAAGGNKKIKVIARREGGKTIIRVMDNGLGLEPSRFEDAFIPFIADISGKLYAKLEKMLNPEDKYFVGTGSGLGLSIIKEIILARKGSITFCAPSGKWKTELEIIMP